MKTQIFLLVIVVINLTNTMFSQKVTKINKYQEFALFVTGKEFPLSIKDATSKNFWEKYVLKLNMDWQHLDTTRLKPLENWQKNEISTKINDTLTLLYPFSGPDFFHSDFLFPNTDNYILLAKEPFGEIPDLSKMNCRQIQDYLNIFSFSIRDFFIRSFFQTNEMKGDLSEKANNGVLSLLLFFLSKNNEQIIDVEHEKLKNINNNSTVECLKITFTKNEKIKTLRYFSCDLSNGGLLKNKALNVYLLNLSEYNTFIKSASYLLHYDNFYTFRNIILKNSRSILQDDTGVPYKYFFNNSDWEQYLYGVYVKPLKLFGDFVFQADLEKAYHSNDVQKLDFSLGYHWKDGQQNQMLFVKKIKD